MAKRPPKERWHLQLSIEKEMWNRLLQAALPVQVAKGEFDLVHDMRGAADRLGLKGRVKGLLEDQSVPEVLRRAQDRAITLWRERRGQVKELVHDLLKVKGTWLVQLSSEGSEFQYGTQRVGCRAVVRVQVEGTALLVRNNYSFPFTLEKTAAASISLVDIRYDRGSMALVGTLSGLLVDLGDHVLYQLLGRAAEMALEQQIQGINPVRILSREQLEGFVSPAGGALKLQMGVEDLDLEVDADNITLKVRFGFTQKQIGTDDDDQ